MVKMELEVRFVWEGGGATEINIKYLNIESSNLKTGVHITRKRVFSFTPHPTPLTPHMNDHTQNVLPLSLLR